MSEPSLRELSKWLTSATHPVHGFLYVSTFFRILSLSLDILLFGLAAGGVALIALGGGRSRQPSRLVDPHRGPQGDLLLRGTANRPLRCFQSPRAPQNEGFRAAVAESPGDRQSKQVGRRIGQFDTRRRSHRSRLRPYFRTTRLGHRRTSGFPPRSGRARGMVSCHHPPPYA